MYFINPNCFRYWIHSIVPLLPETFPDSWVSWKKKKSFKRNFIIVRNISHLPSYLPPPWQRPPPPVTKKDEKLLSAFCELSGKYLSWEQGVIMLWERSKKKKRSKKRKEGRGEIMTKASHCSSSSTLELVVHRLACAGRGWGCPALGPVWKQIFQVSARQKWMRTIVLLSIVNVNEASLPELPWEFPKSSEKCLVCDFFSQPLLDCIHF